MRSMSVGDLANLFETRIVEVDNNDYTIESRAEFVSDNTGTATCTPGGASADYLRVTSTVTWPTMGGRPPVKAASIVTPPNGSIAADRGALAVQVDDAQNIGISGVGLSGTGAGWVRRARRAAPDARSSETSRRQLHAYPVGERPRGQGRQPARAPDDQRDRGYHQHGRPPVRPARRDRRHPSRPGSEAICSSPRPTRWSSSTPA